MCVKGFRTPVETRSTDTRCRKRGVRDTQTDWHTKPKCPTVLSTSRYTRRHSSSRVPVSLRPPRPTSLPVLHRSSLAFQTVKSKVRTRYLWFHSFTLPFRTFLSKLYLPILKSRRIELTILRKNNLLRILLSRRRS